MKKDPGVPCQSEYLPLVFNATIEADTSSR